MKIGIEYLYVALFAVFIAGGFVISPLLSTSQGTESGVRIIKGPTPIMEGEAKGPEDITLMNEYLAVAFGISTTPPWGIPPGHIVDMAVIGEKTSDVVAQFSFPLNDWGNWATITQFEIIENTPQRGIIRAIGTWRGLRVNYTYILESGKPYLEVLVNVTNIDVIPYVNHIMGPAITFERGWTFVPDYGTGRIVTSPKDRWGIIEDWVAGYHEDYAIGLYAPNYTHISLHTFFVDPFYQVTLNPGESRLFKSYIFALDKPDTCRIMEIVYRIRNGELAEIYGLVKSTKGQPLAKAAVIAYRSGKPYCWSITGSNGEYSMPILAPGSYSLVAFARAHGPSSWSNTSVKPGESVNVDFSDVMPPGRLILRVYRNDTNTLTDARILISGGFTPPVQYMTTPTAYTDLFNVGVANIDLAPGTYSITVDHGAGFISSPVTLRVTIESEKTVEANVTVNIAFKPREQGWYTVDLHHHSDHLDGKTPPDLLVVSQLASALDFILVSDHDYIGNCPVIKEYAEMRGKPFICSVEISPDWAHFNVYPIIYPEKLVYRGTLREIITAARAAGAIVVRANHPYVGGLFIAQEMNNIPGGYYEDWDAAEINGPWGSDDARTLSKMFTLWDLGFRKYLTAGSDVHDVITQTYTGRPRVVAYLPSGPNPVALAYAEKYGRTFITYGPFIFTDPLPGSILFARGLNDTIRIRVKYFAINGLDRIEVYVKTGRLLRSVPLNRTISGEVEIQLLVSDVTNNTMNGYVVLIAFDAGGNRAINNPIWVDLAGIPVTTTITMTTTATTTETLTRTTTIPVTHIYTHTYTETTTIPIPTTYTQIRTQTETFTSPTTITERTTELVTQRETITSTVETIKYDIAIIMAIIAFIIGIGLSLVIRRK